MRYRDLIKEALADDNPGKKLSKRELARKIGISPSHIIHFLNRDAKPQKPTLEKLARYFHISESELIDGHQLNEQIMAHVLTMEAKDKEILLKYLKGELQ